MTSRPPKTPWFRTPWVFAACGVGLLALWLILRWLTKPQSSDGDRLAHDSPHRSDVFWAGPSDIIFWVAMVLIAVAVIVRIWRLIRRIRS